MVFRIDASRIRATQVLVPFLVFAILPIVVFCLWMGVVYIQRKKTEYRWKTEQKTAARSTEETRIPVQTRDFANQMTLRF